MTLPVYLSGERIQGKTTDSLASAEVVYTTQCFDDNDDTLDSDQITTRSGNTRLWGGVKVVSSGTLNGKYAVKIRLKLHVNGATTGNLVGQIRSGCTSGSPGSQGTNRLTSTNTIDLATLQDSTTFIEFTFDGSYAFGTNSDEFIGIYWASAESNGSNDIWIAMRWSNETANTADVISATNDGAPSQTDFEFWTNRNTNMSITTQDPATAKDKSSITNVPAGTRYEETDTRKIFRYNDTGYGSPAVGTAGDIVTNSAGTLSQATGSGTIFTSGSELQTGCFDFGSTRVRTGNLQLIPRTNFTVAFWTKADSFSTAGSNSPRYIHGDGNSMIIELGNNANPKIVNFQVATASGTNAKEVAHGMSTGTWYHLAFVYDSSNGDMIIYRDGTAIATDTSNPQSEPIQAHTSWWEFGGGSNEYMDGQMNDFAIWNTKLSSSNISTLVGNKTTTVKRATSVLKTNIVAYWDGSDATVTVPNAALPSSWKEKGTA